ncbi:MAG: hypothetical protein GY795_08150 [Desulfobacterales bacterium]|nr:hypothetical protein [Desulfobacterales bacterium]
MKSQSFFQNMNQEIPTAAKVIIVCIISMLAVPEMAQSQPANDNFADAVVITGLSGQTTGSNTDATKETGEPDHAGNSGGKSIWWTWTAPESGYFSFDTYGSSFDTLLAVYTGLEVGYLTEVACNDDDGIYASRSKLTFQAESGIRYYIAVNEKYGDIGIIILNWREMNSGGFHLEFVSRTLGVSDENLEVTLKGKGFDEHTQVSIYTDVGNKIKIIGSWSEDLNFPLDVAVIGDTAYVADATEGLKIIDVSNPASPVKIGAVDMPDWAYGVAVIGDTAYVAGGKEGLQVIDVGDPTNPVIIGSADTPSSAHNVSIIGDTAYVADGDGGLQVIDVSRPANPVIIGIEDTPGYARNLAVIGDTAYVADQDGLQVIDVSRPESPVIIGAAVTSCSVNSVAVIRDMAYVTCGDHVGGWSGLQLMDMSKPASPVIIGTEDTPGEARDVAVIGDTAYVADGSGGLQVIDVSNPTDPVKIGSMNTSDSANGFVVVGNIAYVADERGGLQLIDVSNSANPVKIGAADTEDSANDVAVIGDMAYMEIIKPKPTLC